LQVVDVTQDLLSDPAIVGGERGERDCLNVVEYLHAVLDQTSKLPELAPRRIAAHLVNGWSGMVGPKISEYFSATAALGLLSDRNLIRALPAMFEKSIKVQIESLSGLSEEEKYVLASSIVDMNGVLHEINLQPRSVYSEAFLLVASRDPVLQGDERAINEVRGLLSLPSVDKKLRDFTGENIVVLQQAKDTLGSTVLKTLARAAKEPGSDLSVITDIIYDAVIPFEATIAILESSAYEQNYLETKAELRFEDIKSDYLRLVREERDLNDLENRLITTFAKSPLRDEQKGMVARGIQRLSNAVSSFESFSNNLVSSRPDYSKKLKEFEEYLKENCRDKRNGIKRGY